ncbi:hypothetical protein ENUP19_0046G0042 [Entamoeba nuttalli]|uniref:Condensation domain-containing protein n=2 Tax=Entamoeba nuttalli TaxID=412467 RepID=K2GC58_ENTNP|nr:hypothetical protein ENU1_101390 [Entamoeba nuttalli P19]EKE40121.1 hypothetical protein ENU1_101390 [Entamoeba nuttalli P19]|eukprot:XP_008857544.1 hypothetical protein ENU1_101390 [Entamoeba nuttalli P19]
MSCSTFEQIYQQKGIQCSFALKRNIPKEDIEKCWDKLMKEYPYCCNYEEEIYSEDNKPLYISIQSYPIHSIQEALDYIIRENSFEVAKTRCFGMKKSSLLIYSYITLNSTQYTIFGMYQCHLKTDFKSIVFLVESFLNYSVQIEHQHYPIQTAYSNLIEVNGIPDDERKEMAELFIQRNVIQYDYSKLKDESLITKDKLLEAQEETNTIIPNCFISKTIKLNQEETTNFIQWCNDNNLSIQATLLAIQLKTYDHLFNKQNKQATTIAFMIPYDIRKFLPKIQKESIGCFYENIYPSYPYNFLQLSIKEMAEQITQYIKNIDEINHPFFDRFRDAVYCGNTNLLKLPYTTTLTNINSFIVMERLHPLIKKDFIDFHISNCKRIQCNKEMKELIVYSYFLFDGTCNISLSYEYSIIPSIISEEVLKEMYSIIITL